MYKKALFFMCLVSAIFLFSACGGGSADSGKIDGLLSDFETKITLLGDNLTTSDASKLTSLKMEISTLTLQLSTLVATQGTETQKAKYAELAQKYTDASAAADAKLQQALSPTGQSSSTGLSSGNSNGPAKGLQILGP